MLPQISSSKTFTGFPGTAWPNLFRDFEDVTLYPVRGQLSSVMSLLHPLKRYRDRAGVERLSNLLDRLFSRNALQTTGYIVSAVKGKSDDRADISGLPTRGA